MVRSLVLIALALVVLFNCILPNVAQSVPSYTYTIVADLPAQPEEWAAGSFSTAALSSDDSIATISLDFPFQFFGANRSSVSFSSNGNAQFSTSSTAYTTPTFPTSLTAYLPIAAFFFSDLNPGTTTSGPVIYRSEGVAPFRSLVVRYANVSVLGSTTDFVYTEVRLNENNTMAWRYYYIPISTRSVTIGVQGDQPLADTSYDYAVVWNNSPMNQTMIDLLVGKTIYWSAPPPAVPASFRTNTSGEYSITHTPGATALDIGTATWTTVETSDDDIDTLPIGFPFTFYGVLYDNVSMSSNGYLQLGESTLTSTTGQAIPSGNSGRVPLIAAFWADLYPGTSGILEYTTFGEVGSRQFAARWFNVTYYGDRTKYLSFDTILHETSNIVEVRYHYLTSYSVNLLIALQNQTTSDSPTPGFAYLNNAARIDSNGLIDTLNGSTVLYTPGGVVPLPSSTGAAAGESSTASASASSTPVIPSDSSSAVSFESSSSASMAASSSSSAVVVPSESSSSATTPMESSSATTPLESSSSASVIPTLSSSSATTTPAVSSSSADTPVMSSSAGISSAIIIPTGCNFDGNTPLGTIINELKINRGIDSLGASFGPQFISALAAFFSSARPNALLPTLGCGGIVGFNNRIGNLVPENENESVVRVLVIPNSDNSNPNATVVTPEEASTTFSDPGLSTSLQAAGLPTIVQSQVSGKRCPDGRDIALDDDCDGDDDDGLTDGEKAGIIVGSVVGGLLLIGLCICLLVSMRRRKSYSSSNTYQTQKTAARGRGVEMGEYDRTEVV